MKFPVIIKWTKYLKTRSQIPTLKKKFNEKMLRCPIPWNKQKNELKSCRIFNAGVNPRQIQAL